MSSVLPHKGTKTRLPFGRDSSLKCVTSSGLALGSWKPISFFAHRWCQKLGSIRAPRKRDGHYAWFNPVLHRALAAGAVNGDARAGRVVAALPLVERWGTRVTASRATTK